MGDRIGKRNNFAGTGMMNSPEYLEELEERKALHGRLTTGKPERTFGAIFEEKMRGEQAEAKSEEGEDEQPPEKGAKDPLLGLSPAQSPELASAGKGRRAGRVILKG